MYMYIHTHVYTTMYLYIYRYTKVNVYISSCLSIYALNSKIALRPLRSLKAWARHGLTRSLGAQHRRRGVLGGAGGASEGLPQSLVLCPIRITIAITIARAIIVQYNMRRMCHSDRRPLTSDVYLTTPASYCTSQGKSSTVIRTSEPACRSASSKALDSTHPSAASLACRKNSPVDRLKTMRCQNAKLHSSSVGSRPECRCRSELCNPWRIQQSTLQTTDGLCVDRLWDLLAARCQLLVNPRSFCSGR